jgi:PIN domain nuclease of toxin-antitoxin system
MPTNYQNVNAAWPADARAPTPQEAIAGARKLVRLALSLGPANSPKRKFRGKFKPTSGNRRTWTRGGVFYVNPAYRHPSFSGWKGIVHDISHWAFNRLYDRNRLGPHAPQHAYIERRLAEYVVKSGWLDGKLARAKAKPPTDRQQARYARTVELIAAWERKEKLAKTKLRKLKLRKKYYEKSLRQRDAIKASRMAKRRLDLGEAKQLAAPTIAGRTLDLS